MFCVRTVVYLFLDCHRQSKIVFYAGFSPALGVQKSVRFLHFIKVLTDHHRTLTRYIWYQWCSTMIVVMFYDKEYSCLSKLWSHACMWQLLHYNVHNWSFNKIEWIYNYCILYETKIYMHSVYIFVLYNIIIIYSFYSIKWLIMYILV